MQPVCCIDGLHVLQRDASRELTRVGDDGHETYEAALASELQAMREAYEGKLAAAQRATRDAQLAHRREVRQLEEGRNLALGAVTPRTPR